MTTTANSYIQLRSAIMSPYDRFYNSVKSIKVQKFLDTHYKIGDYGFMGSCANIFHFGKCETFSVGVFKWLEKKDNGIKPGPVIVRVRGSSITSPTEVYTVAMDICQCLINGYELKVKSISAKHYLAIMREKGR